jgi:two-component system nitrate/nitrite response regulator NarL
VSTLELEEAELAASSHGVSDADAEGRARLALVDPSRLRRDCLKVAVRSEGWHVVDMPAVRDLLQRLIRGETFGAVLIGGGGAGVEEVARLAAAAPRSPILVAVEGADDRNAERLLAAGARGVLPANASLRTLVAALADIRGDFSAPPRPLTRRQRQVLALISQGKSNRLIAASLSVSEETVKAHVKQIIRRLGVTNRTQAALIAAGAGVPFDPVLPQPLRPGVL